MNEISPLLYQTFDSLSEIPQVAVMALALCAFLGTARRLRFTLIFVPVCTFASWLTCCLASGTGQPYMSIVGLVCPLALALIFNRVSFIKALLAVAVSMLCNLLCELIICPPMLALTGLSSLEPFFVHTYAALQLMFYLKLAFAAMLILIYYLVYTFIWRRLVPDMRQKAVSPYLPFLATQINVHRFVRRILFLFSRLSGLRSDSCLLLSLCAVGFFPA